MAQNISKTFSNIGENIRKIRQAKKISQAQFAQLFNLARPSVGAYEEGRSEPKIDTIIQIAKYFRISIDVLLTKKLSVSEIYSFDLLNEKLDKAHRLKEEGKVVGVEVPFIPIEQYLNYIVNYNSNSYIRDLQKIKLPISDQGEYRAFELNGTEMEHQQQGLHHGNLLIGKRVDLKELKTNLDQVLILVTAEEIIARRLAGLEGDQIMLSADNPNYEEIMLKKKNVLEVWVSIGVYNTKLNPPSRMEERMLMIEEELKKLRDSSDT